MKSVIISSIYGKYCTSHHIFKVMLWLVLKPKYELKWTNGYMPLWATFDLLSLLKIICNSMGYSALHFSGQQKSPSFRQFSVSAPQHLPQLCTTQQKPREVESWASVAHHAMLCIPVMSQYLEGWKCRHCASRDTWNIQRKKLQNRGKEKSCGLLNN